jgi:glycosyltransferase involved in cell wall biosynthesis
VKMTEIESRREMYDVVYIPLGAAAMGGAERSIAYLAQGMQERGKRVLILAERALRDSGYADFVSRLGVPMEWVDWAPEKSFVHNWLHARAAFRQRSARIIHFNQSWRHGMWAVALAARVHSSARLIGTIRAMPDPHDRVPRRRYLGVVPGIRLWHWPEVTVGWLWSRLLDCGVSVNAIDYPTRLIKDYGFRRERLRAIYNGVWIRSEPVSAARRTEIRTALGLKGEDILVNFAGRLSREKGVHYLIEAMERLPEKYKLIVLGVGPEKEAYERLAAHLELGARVRFLGFVEQVDDYMVAADVMALPSTWHEACPRQVIEAMSHGVPVVASRIGGMAELFDDGVEGVYVSPRSAKELAEAIGFLGENEKTRTRMGREARRRAVAQYSMDKVIDAYESLYAELTPSAKEKGNFEVTS